jgi:hypothetical protein
MELRGGSNEKGEKKTQQTHDLGHKTVITS